MQSRKGDETVRKQYESVTKARKEMKAHEYKGNTSFQIMSTLALRKIHWPAEVEPEDDVQHYVFEESSSSTLTIHHHLQQRRSV